MKKTMKILSTMMVIMMMVSSVTTVFASGATAGTTGDMFVDISPTQSSAATGIQNAAGQILGIVQVIAMAVAVIMLIVLAIKYISSAPEGKAEIKKTAFIYVFGAILMFGASGILGWIKGMNLFA